MSEASPDIKDEWVKVRNDRTKSHWLILEPTPSFKTLQLVSKGSGGLDEFRAAMEDHDSAILFGGFRCRAIDDEGTVQSIRHKFVLITCTGSNVASMYRARATVIKAEVDRIFGGVHVSFNISSPSELTAIMLTTRLNEIAGAHRPKRYDFDGCASMPELLDDDSPEAMSLTRGTSSLHYQSSKSLRTQLCETKCTNDSSETVVVKVNLSDDTNISNLDKVDSHNSLTSSASKHDITNIPLADDGFPISTEECWRLVLKSNHPLTWVIVRFDGKFIDNPPRYRVGTSGLEGLKKELDPTMALFCGLRCKAIDDRGSVQSVRPKYIFITFLGTEVPYMVRARAATSQSKFEQILSHSHISVQISDVQELKEEDLIKQLQASCGAHKPNGYDFSGGPISQH